jgi:hypothetical protein
MKMKKLSVFIIVAVAAFAAFMTSCDKEPVNTSAPSIEMITGDTTIASGAGITIKGNIEAPGNIGTITYYKDGVAYGTPITSGFDSDTATYFEVQFTNVTEAFTFKVEVEDLQKEPKSTMSNEITIGIGGPVDIKDGLKIYCAAADQTGNGDYADLEPTFEIWNHNQAEVSADIIAKIDVWYYNGNYTKEIGGNPHFVSPDTKTNTYDTHSGVVLPGANTTKLLVLTDVTDFADWNAIASDAVIAGIDFTSATYNVEFGAGDIIAFQLENGKKGVMKVVGGTAGYNITDYVLVDVIVQQNAPVTK